MPAIILHNSKCSGHSGFPPRKNLTASDNFFFNNKGVVRVGDSWETHTSGDSSHNGTQKEGSPNFFVNGKPVARIGDAISCGSVCANGSPNTFIN